MRNVVDNVVLSENYTFFTGDAGAQAHGGEYGLYNRDTRFLCRYAWTFPEGTQTLQVHSPRPDNLAAHYAELDHHRQLVAVRRNLSVGDGWLNDLLRLENLLLEPRTLRLELHLDADFADLFEVRGWPGKTREVSREASGNTVRFSYRAEDGVELMTELTFSHTPDVLGDSLVFGLELLPKSSESLEIKVRLSNPLETGAVNSICYEDWREKFSGLRVGFRQPILDRAINDLRALLLFDESGRIPAAGIPWFAAAFGRDSILTAHMLLRYAPNIAAGTLRYLAHYQAKEASDFQVAQPGKILHERRVGELSRTGRMPFGPYYGTVDATPLFVTLLGTYFEQTNDLDLVCELRPNWEAALQWITTYGDSDGDGFLEFHGSPDGQDLHVQSWKDSEDSMSHADGTLTWGNLAVCEVQGYAFAAHRAASSFYQALGETAEAERWRTKAEQLKTKFHKAFWLDDLQTYAMALDNEKQPLRVHNSGAGHLLWSGIVPEDTAPKLIESLMSEETWTGWGLRTLGKSAARYNPVSYHNGSVWPHDTALVAKGMLEYGFIREATQIAEALFDLSASQHDLRPPELVSGYTRDDSPPVPYPTACRPQAWSSAALVFLAEVLE